MKIDTSVLVLWETILDALNEVTLNADCTLSGMLFFSLNVLNEMELCY